MHSKRVKSLLSFVHITCPSGDGIDDYIPHYQRHEDIASQHNSPLLLVIKTIPFMPYVLRKFLLDFSRIQQPVFTNIHLKKTLQVIRSGSGSTFYLPAGIRVPLFANLGILENRKLVSIDDITPLLQNIYDDPIGLSVLSYFVRAEATIFPEEFRKAGDETIAKEILASLEPNTQQALDYRGIFTDEKVPVHIELNLFPERTSLLWKSQIRRICQYYTNERTILFPHYNGKKNVSYSTQNLILSFLNDGEPIMVQPTDYTSLSLLKIYHEHGVQLGGDMELREAWRFNDLKPRGYYCLGGKTFWASCYVKDFTKRIQETMMSTHPFSRFDVHRIHTISDEELVITYDYSAFTTSLAELKYFLWYLSNCFCGTMVNVLDVFSGVIDMDFGEYLREYNEVVNMNQVVSLIRLLKRGSKEPTDHFQGRSGSLGGGGNIGLSTACHGLSVASMTDTPDEDSVVGDDAMISMLADLITLYIVIINKLGIIHPEKVATLRKPPVDRPQMSAEQGFKYLKRPITLDSCGSLQTGYLDFFPNLGVCLRPEGDGIHTQRAETVQEILKTFCTQWGRYLSQYNATPFSMDITIQSDIDLILNCVQAVYFRYGLPFSGCLPYSGFFFASSFSDQTLVSEVNWWCPPCEDDSVFKQHWLDVLFSTFSGREFTLPVEVGSDIPLPRMIYPGYTHKGTLDNLSSILVDLDHASAHIEQMRLTFDDYTLERTRKQFLGQLSEKVLYSIYIHTLPVWYDDVYSILHPLPIPSGPYGNEARDEISTLWDEVFSEHSSPSTSSMELDDGFAE
jgi:hypothetical protein